VVDPPKGSDHELWAAGSSGDQPGQAAKDMPPSGSRPRNGASDRQGDHDGDNVACGAYHAGAPFETTAPVSCGAGQITPVKDPGLIPWGEPRKATRQRPSGLGEASGEILAALAVAHHRFLQEA
jgi:hypothetical protein